MYPKLPAFAPKFAPYAAPFGAPFVCVKVPVVRKPPVVVVKTIKKKERPHKVDALDPTLLILLVLVILLLLGPLGRSLSS